jgi:type VI secretion system protein ImpC
MSETAPVQTGSQTTLLDRLIETTPATERSRAEGLLRALVEASLEGTVTYTRTARLTIDQARQKIAALISEQVSAVLHAPEFQTLEGSWRGLHYLMSNTELGQMLRIHVLNVTKQEMLDDFRDAQDFDRSSLWTKLYENAVGTPGKAPYGALIGDYAFDKSNDDIELLQNISRVSAIAFAPFIASVAPGMFGFDNWTQLRDPIDIASIFMSDEYIKWNAFRESEDSRFVALTLPRVLSRQPYGRNGTKVKEFDFEEGPLDEDGNSLPMPHGHYAWMNAAYAMAARLTDAFAKYGWCTAIRGYANGGKVENLPIHVVKTERGDMEAKCPTEILIPDRREYEFSNAGFLALCNYASTDYAVFFSGQTVQKPANYSRLAVNAQANARLSARLPYVLAASRFSHYIKVMGRDMVGSALEARNIEVELNQWIKQYVNSNADAGPETKAAYPLADARVEVREIAGQPGAYNAVVYMRPWLQLEELTASLSMVARIPGTKG